MSVMKRIYVNTSLRPLYGGLVGVVGRLVGYDVEFADPGCDGGNIAAF